MITVKGQTLTGIVSNGAPGEMVVLQTDGTKRVLKESDVDEITPSKISAMPEGLLNDLTSEEIADLFAFLTTTPQANVTVKPAENTSR